MSSRVTRVLLVAATLAGCARMPARGADRPAPTFAKDVAPILFAKCAPCHHSGEIAPFPLLEYADAARWSDSIAIETRARVTAARVLRSPLG